MNCMLFQNNYVKIWNELLKRFIKIKQVAIISVGGNICNQNESSAEDAILISDYTSIDLRWTIKDISRFIWQEQKPHIKYKTLQDAREREREGLGLPDLKLYFAACGLVWMKEWLGNRRLLELEILDLRFGWHGYLWFEKFTVNVDLVNFNLIGGLYSVNIRT